MPQPIRARLLLHTSFARSSEGGGIINERRASTENTILHTALIQPQWLVRCWWLFPRLRRFWENVRLFIPRLRLKKKKSTWMLVRWHLGQRRTTNTTVPQTLEYPLDCFTACCSQCVWTRQTLVASKRVSHTYETDVRARKTVHQPFNADSKQTQQTKLWADDSGFRR